MDANVRIGPLAAMRPLIVMTDAAALGDDGVAIAMLATAGTAGISLIVATSGNVWGQAAAGHVRALLRRLDKDGLSLCIAPPPAFLEERARKLDRHADQLHYVGALAGRPPAEPLAEAFCSSDELFSRIAAANRPDILVLGPSTPLASLIGARPNLADEVGRIYLMGGAIAGPGNATRAAEFNFWFDAEAAERLLASDIPLTLLPLDAVRTMRHPAGLKDRLDPGYGPAAYVLECLSRSPAPLVCDEVLAAAVLDPTIIRRQTAMKLKVEVADGARYGSVTILEDGAARRAVNVIEEIDHDALWRLIGRIFIDRGG
jgi:inosine-uridine nucleoside N-ribohydrolase